MTGKVSAPLLAVTLAGLVMLGPFSVDTYLPSFPAIQREFAVTPLQLQQTLTAYLVAFAVMTLFLGRKVAPAEFGPDAGEAPATPVPATATVGA